MSKRIYIKDYWGQRDIIIAKSDNLEPEKLVSIGVVLDESTEQWVHLKANDLLKCLKDLGISSEEKT